MMRGTILAALAALLVATAPAAAQEPELVDQNDAWSVYVHDNSDEKICFVVSEPRTQKPEGVRRGPVYFYLSSWANDGVSNEVSVKMGYPLQDGVDVEVTIGNSKFALFPMEQGAYVDGQDNEKELVDAMRRGATMVVQGRSQRGTLTTDEYSLIGVTASLERVAQECS